MNIGTFLRNVANLRHFGWRAEILSNIVTLRHSFRAPHGCDPVTAVCLEVNSLTYGELEAKSFELEFVWTAASRILDFDSDFLDTLINPANYPDRHLSRDLLQALFDDQADLVMVKLREFYPQQPLLVPNVKLKLVRFDS